MGNLNRKFILPRFVFYSYLSFEGKNAGNFAKAN